MEKYVPLKVYIFFVLAFFSSLATASSLSMKISKKYLNFPISSQVERKQMILKMNGREICNFQIRLAASQPDYWVFMDVSAYHKKILTLDFDGSLAGIFQSDTIFGESDIYNEKNRPQYHFTTRRGWINDPNGLVYDKRSGYYHLYYQHNPFEREWGNMHWGHAVSKDLLHWKEYPIVLHPDEFGTMFSGSAVIDWKNVAGFGRGALIAFYTADSPEKEVQCMAYSLDGGFSFKKYKNNPIIDSSQKWHCHDTRDPKVFWYEEGKHWVLVLNERNGHSIYNSTNLRDWTFQSHIVGFWECPDLFELSVAENPSEKHWVLWGASGTYMVGQFNGKEFIPETPKQRNMGRCGYAAQTYNELPEAFKGKAVKMTWGQISFPDMPFNGCMLLPQEQTLHKVNGKLCLYSYPIKTVDQLFNTVLDADKLDMAAANKVLELFKDDDVIRLQMDIEMTFATATKLTYRGQTLFDYDPNYNLINNMFYASPVPDSLRVKFDVFIDRGVVEVFVDDGAFSYSFARDVLSKNQEGYLFHGNPTVIHHLKVMKATSIWNSQK